MTYSIILWDANPCNTNYLVGVKPSLLIALHRRSIRTMILPVGAGRQEGIPSPNFSLIVALGHSPLSFASRRWSPQRSILGTQSPHLAYDRLVPRPKPYVDKPQFTWPRLMAELIWPPAMGAKRSAWTAAQSCRIGRSNGSI